MDVTPPSVYVLQPANGSYTNGAVNISWNASNNFGINHFEISVDGSEFENIGNVREYSLELDEG